VDQAKPFSIAKREVWEAFKRVKANQGAAGVDGQSIAEFEANLSGNLYKLWNRLSSGSYFPPPVRRVEIPKASGGTRPLGIPTVADRIAQEVVRRALEPILEPVFHPRLLRLPTRQICHRCRRESPRALLALGLGSRPRYQGVL
jgi:retron-type reverse transcriptase